MNRSGRLSVGSAAMPHQPRMVGNCIAPPRYIDSEVNRILCKHRSLQSFLAHAALLMVVLAVTERECVSLIGDGATATKPAVRQVFPPPSEAELSTVEHPELRLELLKMVSEDQVARSAGT